MALRSCGRSVRAPDCFSLNMRVAPAALSAAIWSSSVWPSVETRQYPMISGMSGTPFCIGVSHEESIDAAMHRFPPT
jgi:hypothetical protein